MQRALLNFWLDTLMLFTFLATLWLKFVLRFVFPAGSAAAGWTLWGATYDQWFGADFVVTCLFAAMVLLHVMLHWTWVCGVITTKILPNSKRRWTDGERTLVGVGLMVVIFNVLGIAFAAAKLMIIGP